MIEREPANTLRLPNIEGVDSLAELALDLRWAAKHAADELWKHLDSELWDLSSNPCVVLQSVSKGRLESVLADPAFRKKLDELIGIKRLSEAKPGWFQQNFSSAPLTSVAYFSMEFMLSEALPIYAGGLGNVAGDQLKAASDLAVPVIGIGLLYQQGYFRQVIDRDGAQQALFPYNDPGQLPVTPVRAENGEWLRLRFGLPAYRLWLRAWQVQVGRTRLYLLDSNDPSNLPTTRVITGELYGGGSELRLQQELVLGIGGWRLLDALGIRAQVCHLNEGHCAFAVLERARIFMEQTGQNFEVALTATRAGNLFTTHTPVAAGFDHFAPALIEQYLGRYARNRLGIPIQKVLALGRQNPNDSSEPFNPAYLAIRGSGAVNGVSRLHGEVSRQLFQPLFFKWPQVEVPVEHVTNGVHMPSWDSEAADEVWTQCCGKDRWLGAVEKLEGDIRSLPDPVFWQLRGRSRKSLIEYTRNRLSRELGSAGASEDQISQARNILDINVLTLGFARRFAPYKRPTLLLHDSERLLRILTNPQRPVQLILAGKAHPADQAGQAMIQQWIRFIRQTEARQRVVFLSDHDMLLTERLVQGVDVWLNTPRRPWEASGTSGMKVLVNGGLNLSELDGWWAEAFTPEVGWALGDGKEHGEDPAWDAAEAEALYRLLEQEVVPDFYNRDQRDIPTRWVSRMRESMARLTPRFSTNRTVREYTERHYLPAAANYLKRAADRGAVAEQIVKWRGALEEKWVNLRFGALRVDTLAEEHAFEVQLYLGDLDPDWVRVELYANGTNAVPPVRQEMTRVPGRVGPSGAQLYRVKVRTLRPASDFTPRAIPRRDGVTVPLEVAQILWHH